ncbi:MAG: IclR family transcriptional regulator C-terminal domain-containing protein [Rhodococcus sp. (in: high G+C Gram-positive bacteria)]|uniref:IclR family transcriptional regulator domain-containing protein n=1 Tax=Rhodococcus sp. TaxID=1831 RepID=UPI003BB0CCDA
MSENDRDYIQSIERGFAVLLAFDAQRPNPTLAELAVETNLSRPAVRRILLTLQRLGYVTGSNGRWSLTPRVLSIGQHYSESHALVEAAMPRLLEVADKTQESASLGVLDGPDVVYAARVPVRRIMSINVSVGTRVPAYATSMGRALLAWAPDDTVERVIAESTFEKLGPETIGSAPELKATLREVRQQGYALTSEELEKGLISLAAPVRDAAGAVVGVVACSTSSARNTPEQFREQAVPCVLAAAAALSSDMGFSG